MFVSDKISQLKSPTILLLTGEASGDIWGADLSSELKKKWPQSSLLGIGGPLMENQGVELIERIDRLSVMGLTGAIKKLPFLLSLKRKISHLLESQQIDLVIAIDFAGFNMSVIGLAHRRNVKVLYYVVPKVWAWGSARTARLIEHTDRIAVIFPFEEEFFRTRGCEVSFVGHPLLDRIQLLSGEKKKFCQKWGLDPERPILALFPGSRPQEITRHLNLFVETGFNIKKLYPEIQLVLARAHSIASTEVNVEGVSIVEDGMGLLSHSRAGLLKSGTVTLEACLARTPFVTVYKTDPLTFLAAKNMVKVKNISIPNLVVNDDKVPEFLQGEATPENLMKELIPLLKIENPEYQEMLDYFDLVESKLGTPGAAGRVVEIADLMLREG